MYYQLLMYSGLCPGIFGGFIDDVHEGMLESTRKYFYGIWGQPNINKETGYIFYKYYQNNFVGHLFEECFIECLAVLIITLVNVIGSYLFDRQKMKPIREMRTSIFLFSCIPITVHVFHGIMVYHATDEYNFYNLFNCAVSFIIYVIFVVQFFFMIRGCDHIIYLHSRGVYQEGKVEFEEGIDLFFDTYISMDTQVWIRAAEFFIFAAIGFLYVIGFKGSSLCSILILVLYLVLLVFSILKYREFNLGTEERKAQKRIIIFSIIHLFLISVQHVIYFIFWIFEDMSIGMATFFSVIWGIVFLVDVIVLLTQLVFRFLSFLITDTSGEGRKANYYADQEDYQSAERNINSQRKTDNIASN